MNKKGLTLIELIAVIAIIALLAIIIYPQVSKNLNGLKTDTNEVQKTSIKEAAKQYLVDHIEQDLFVDGQTEISLKILVDEGYIYGSTKDTITGRNYDLENSKVIIKRSGETPNYIYDYTVNLYNK